MEQANKFTLEPQAISVDVLTEKYCKNDESAELEVFKRVAKGIASVEKTPALRKRWEKLFLENMLRGAYGAGRIMSAAGTEIQATLINCFTQPIGDNILNDEVTGSIGIYTALAEAAETMRRGGGEGYDFSSIRPRGAYVKGTHSYASGPCSYIDIFDSSGKTVESAGARRGAQLGALRVDHPDIEEYIVAKRTEGRWNGFNVSVYVTDDFMKAVEAGEDWELAHKVRPGPDYPEAQVYQREDGWWVYRKVNARELWDKIMRSNYEYAEPGILFGDTINRMNNLSYAEVIKCTNPCGEQPLPDYGCCDLGPIDLTRFVLNPFTADACFDFVTFEQAVAVQNRFLDNVLDATYWPLEKQKQEAMNKRRIGIGFTGLGNALAMLNIKYSSEAAVMMAGKITQSMACAAYRASVELAKEKGSFPLFDADQYLNGENFVSQLPQDIQDDIRKHGIRNSHLLSIAPVGTMSLALCDNASNGVEPPFSLGYIRKKREDDGSWKDYLVLDHALRVFLSLMENKDIAQLIEQAICSGKTTFVHYGEELSVKQYLPESLETAMEITAQEHLRVMAACQRWIDSAISKTVNVAVDYPFEDFKDIYMQAWKFGCKGVSTYRPNAILGSVLSEIKAEEEVVVDNSAAIRDYLYGYIDKRGDNDFPAISKKVSFISPDGESTFRVLIAFDEKTFSVDGKNTVLYRPMEVFVETSSENVPSEWVKAFSVNLSMAARAGLHAFIRMLEKMREVKSDFGRIRYGWYVKQDGSRVPRYHTSGIAIVAYVIQEELKKRNIIDDNGSIIEHRVTVEKRLSPAVPEQPATSPEDAQPNVIHGKLCGECGAHAVVKRDGCTICTNCNVQGSCG